MDIDLGLKWQLLFPAVFCPVSLNLQHYVSLVYEP